MGKLPEIFRIYTINSRLPWYVKVISFFIMQACVIHTEGKIGSSVKSILIVGHYIKLCRKWNTFLLPHGHPSSDRGKTLSAKRLAKPLSRHYAICVWVLACAMVARWSPLVKAVSHFSRWSKRVGIVTCTCAIPLCDPFSATRIPFGMQWRKGSSSRQLFNHSLRRKFRGREITRIVIQGPMCDHPDPNWSGSQKFEPQMIPPRSNEIISSA